jgi:hypothetical protein
MRWSSRVLEARRKERRVEEGAVVLEPAGGEEPARETIEADPDAAEAGARRVANGEVVVLHDQHLYRPLCRLVSRCVEEHPARWFIRCAQVDVRPGAATCTIAGRAIVESRSALAGEVGARWWRSAMVHWNTST